MAFTPNIPATGQSLGFTKVPIKDNFAVIRSTIAANHYDVNDALAGKHKFSVYPVQGPNPVVTTATEIATYALQTGSTINMFLKGISAGPEYQLTSTSDADIATFGTQTNYPPAVANQDGGWTFLPGGLLLQYGTKTLSASTVSQVTFPIPYAINGLYSVTYAIKTQLENRLSSETETGFQVRVTDVQAGIRYYWMAIGKQA